VSADPLHRLHGVSLDRVSILVRAGERDAVPSLTQIGDHVSADFELGLVRLRVAVRRALDETVLGPKGSIGSMDVHRQRD
jgi:hypothetical protein